MDRLTEELHRNREKNNLLRGDTDHWITYGSSTDDYDKSFRSVLGESHIIDFVRGSPEPIVIDLMSSTEALASLFTQLPQQHKLGISVSLEDTRRQEEKTRDTALGVKHLEGDLSVTSTWKNLKDKLKGKRADLILSRSGMGIHHVPFNEKYYAYVLNRLWEMVSENDGVILIQAPIINTLKRLDIRIGEWVNLLKANNIDVVFSEGGDDLGFDYARIKIVRSPESPKSLPFLK